MTKAEVFEKLASRIDACHKCPLYETAQHAVPGEGNINASLVFIGEAPGANEARTGRPFVGRAGKLLDTMLDRIGMSRADVWIGNVIKHRPPNNRDPLPNEIKACSPYLTVQLKLIKPKLVVTLGRFALNYFYPSAKISRDHGILLADPSRFAIYPVYHPAAALRRGDFMQAFEEDFLRIPQILRRVELEKFNASIKSSRDEEKGQLRLDL